MVELQGAPPRNCTVRKGRQLVVQLLAEVRHTDGVFDERGPPGSARATPPARWPSPARPPAGLAPVLAVSPQDVERLEHAQGRLRDADGAARQVATALRAEQARRASRAELEGLCHEFIRKLLEVEAAESVSKRLLENCRPFVAGYAVPQPRAVEATPLDVLVAQRVQEEAREVVRGVASERTLDAVRGYWLATRGFDAQQAWIEPLMERIASARLRLVNARTASRLSEGRRSRPSTTPRALGKWVLENVRDETAAWPRDAALPSWVDEELVAWLITRFSFQGGGGRAITQPKMIKLLCQPKKLVAELKRVRRRFGPEGRAWVDKLLVRLGA